MRPRRTRTPVATAHERMTAVLAHPALYLLGDVIPDAGVGRRRHHPNWMLPAYAALTRIWSSSARLDNELRAPGVWNHLRDVSHRTQSEIAGRDVEELGARPFSWDHFRQLRNWVVDDAALFDDILDTFTRLAVGDARSVGLLDPKGPGSLTHPHPSRAVFGDGTVVRPIYKVREGAEGRRQDPDATDHYRHDGRIHGNNLVAITCRGPAAYQRVVLAIGRVDAPGREADTALELIDHVHRHAGGGIQAVIYDGALRGRHHDHLMRHLGVVPINKVPAARAATETEDRVARRLPLGVFTHEPNGRACRHTIAAIDGALNEIAHDETGELVIVRDLERRQLKRARRMDRTFHWTIVARVHCPKEPFDILVSPHGTDDPDFPRADLVRLIPPGDDDHKLLYALRNDAEALNSQFKRTLLVDRATSLGWRRQLLDLLGFALLNNAIAVSRHGTLATVTQLRRAG